MVAGRRLSVVFKCSGHFRDKEDRHIPNCMLDFGAFIAQSSLEAQGFEASPTFKQLQQDTRTWIHRNVELIVKSFPPSSQFSPKSVRGKAKSDSSIYVGCGGNAYLHWKLTSFFEAEGDSEKVEFHRKSALTAIGVALSLLPPKPEEEGEGIAFYIGSAGRWVCMYPTDDHLAVMISCLSRDTCISNCYILDVWTPVRDREADAAPALLPWLQFE